MATVVIMVETPEEQKALASDPGVQTTINAQVTRLLANVWSDLLNVALTNPSVSAAAAALIDQVGAIKPIPIPDSPASPPIP